MVEEPAGMLEDQIEQEVVERAEQFGYVTRKLQWKGRKSAPDRIFFGFGRCVLIEFKAPGERPIGHQAKEIRRLQERYSEVYVCDNRAQALMLLGIPA